MFKGIIIFIIYFLWIAIPPYFCYRMRYVDLKRVFCKIIYSKNRESIKKLITRINKQCKSELAADLYCKCDMKEIRQIEDKNIRIKLSRIRELYIESDFSGKELIERLNYLEKSRNNNILLAVLVGTVTSVFYDSSKFLGEILNKFLNTPQIGLNQAKPAQDMTAVIVAILFGCSATFALYLFDEKHKRYPKNDIFYEDYEKNIIKEKLKDLKIY